MFNTVVISNKSVALLSLQRLSTARIPPPSAALSSQIEFVVHQTLSSSAQHYLLERPAYCLNSSRDTGR
jgi:hypothetical protein